MIMDKELLQRVKEDGIKFVSLQFSDVSGAVKSVDIPTGRLSGVLKNGIWFDGSSVEGFARIQESDMRLKPDLNTYAVLPWGDEHNRKARLFCDIYGIDGKPFPGDPRAVLRRVLERIEERGWKFNIGPEPEFFLFRKDKGETMHPLPYDIGGYFDFSTSNEAEHVLSELMLALEAMGLEVEMGHHEVALGQHEIDFRFADALTAADNVVTMKYTVKALAARNNLLASFMPKPIFGINGSGMHTHQSIFDSNGVNLFYDANDEFSLSTLAYQFIAGQMKHARALAAIAAPTVNSYKRIVPGYEAPVYICWAQINRSAMIRIPQPGVGREVSTRAELRFPDPSCNPYLAFAGMLAAGLDGIESELECPPPLNNLNIYELTEAELKERKIDQLPGSLEEALIDLENDQVIRDALGSEAYTAFARVKNAEWNNYRTHVVDWEIETYLESA